MADLTARTVAAKGLLLPLTFNLEKADLTARTVAAKGLL